MPAYRQHQLVSRDAATVVRHLDQASSCLHHFDIDLLRIWIARHHPPMRWHPHHLAERFGLLAIITFGEGIIGTMAAIQAVAAEQGWTLDVGMIGLAGLSLTVGMWWVYFALPQAELLHARPRKMLGWSYGHMVVYAAIAGTGAGLHLAAFLVEDKSKIGLLGTVLSMALPVGVFLLAVYALFHYLAPGRHRLHVLLLLASAALLAIATAMATAGASLNACLLVLMLVPWVTVVGYERLGHRQIEQSVAEAEAAHGDA